MTYKGLVVGIALAAAAVSASAAQSGNQAFVTKMGEVSLGEVDLGRLADEKASSRDVKGFAKRMIEEHGKSGEELKGIAARKSMTWPAGPGADAKALKDKLSKLSGTAFDRAYIDAMVDGHRKVLDVVKAEAQSNGDAELKAFATKASSSVQAHLAHALDVQRETGRAATH